MYLFFIFILLAVFFITLIIFKKELFAPPVMMTFVFLMCSIVVLARYDDWNLRDYSIKSVGLLLIGIVMFILGGVIAYFGTANVYLESARIGMIRKKNIKDRIDIPFAVILLALFLGICEIFLFTRYIKEAVIIMNYNHSSVSNLLVSYRQLSMNNLISSKHAIPTYLSLMKYTVESFSAFSTYIFLHNWILKCFKVKDVLLLGVIFVWPLNALLTSSRGDILTLMAEVIYLIYFFYGIEYGFTSSTDEKVFGKGIRLLLCFLIFFFSFSLFQNRINRDNTLFNSVTIYIGGGIRAFDDFVKKPVKSNTGLIGNDETLRYFSTFMSVHLHKGTKTLLPLEFRYINGKSIGNIFTAFRRYYSDFGIGGIICFSSILGYIMTLMYEKSKRSCIERKNSFVLLLFVWLSKPIFYMAIEEYFFVSNLSLNCLYKIMVLFCLYIMFVEKRYMD